jgi:hypothetical protein
MKAPVENHGPTGVRRPALFARVVVVAGALTTIAVVVLAINLRRDRAAAATQQRAAINAGLQRWNTRMAEAARQRTALQAELAKLEKTKAPATADPAARPPSIAEQLQTNPTAQISALAHKRAHVLATYGAFFRKLGLSGEQIARFQDIVLRKKERIMDLQAIMGQQGLTWRDQAIDKLRRDGEAEYASAQRALLGDDALRKLEDYEHTSWLREMMIGWAGGAVVVAREPFTPDQAEQLVQIMANASPNYRHGYDAMTHEPGYWAAVEAEARKILTPGQFNYFTTMEPPLPVGARFQTQFYDKVSEALEAEAEAKKKALPAKPSGG